MKFARYLLINALVFVAVIWGGLGEGTMATIAGNLFIGVTILTMLAIVICGAITMTRLGPPMFREMALNGKEPPTRSVTKEFDQVLDFILALVAFGMGFWVCGVVWCLLGFVSSAITDPFYDPENYKVSDQDAAFQAAAKAYYDESAGGAS